MIPSLSIYTGEIASEIKRAFEGQEGLHAIVRHGVPSASRTRGSIDGAKGVAGLAVEFLNETADIHLVAHHHERTDAATCSRIPGRNGSEIRINRGEADMVLVADQSEVSTEIHLVTRHDHRPNGGIAVRIPRKGCTGGRIKSGGVITRDLLQLA